MFEQGSSSVSLPLLVVVVFWLALIFCSFGLLPGGQCIGPQLPKRFRDRVSRRRAAKLLGRQFASILQGCESLTGGVFARNFCQLRPALLVLLLFQNLRGIDQKALSPNGREYLS